MDHLKGELELLYAQKRDIEDRIKQIESTIQKQYSGFLRLKDAIYIDISNLANEVVKTLKDLATFENPQVKILNSLRKPLYNTPRNIISYEIVDNKLVIPRGLMRGVIELFKKYALDYSFKDERVFHKQSFKKIKFSLRQEQQKAVDEIQKKDFSLFVAPPGFGKTLIGSKMIELRGCNTLVIVNKNMLLDQWCDRFIDYFGYTKDDIGYLGKSKNKLNGKLDIATMQSLKNNLEVIKNYSFVIVDECHHIPAVTFEKIIKKFQGRYILGLSATPNRKDGMEPLIYQQLGTIAYEIKSKKSSTNRLEIVESQFDCDVESFSDLITHMINSDYRNNLILDKIKQYKNRKILLLTDRIEHIENLELLLRMENIEFVSIHGSLKKNIQDENMQQVETSSLVLATTSYFGEGIDFKHLDTIIFATPISYYGRLVQYLGRIGRGGDDCLAIDILDINNKFALSSYKKRKDGYKQLHYRRSK